MPEVSGIQFMSGDLRGAIFLLEGDKMRVLVVKGSKKIRSLKRVMVSTNVFMLPCSKKNFGR